MHNLKEIRKDLNAFRKALENRFVKIDFKKLENLDKQNREFIQKKETLEKEKKDISKSKDKSLFEKSKKISIAIEKITKEQNVVKKDLEEILSTIPNIPHADVPKEVKADMELVPELLRLAVGIEHIDDLLDDVKQALK